MNSPADCAAPILHTERLVLRPFAPGDLSDLVRLAGERRIADTTISVPHPFTREDGLRWIEVNDGALRSGTGH